MDNSKLYNIIENVNFSDNEKMILTDIIKIINNKNKVDKEKLYLFTSLKNNLNNIIKSLKSKFEDFSFITDEKDKKNIEMHIKGLELIANNINIYNFMNYTENINSLLSVFLK